MFMLAHFGKASTGATAYYRLLNSDKTEHAARTTAGVTETPAGTGTFGVEVAEATMSGRTILWDLNGTTMYAAEMVIPPSGTANLLVTAVFGSINTGKSVYYQVLNSDGSVSVARTSTGVTELVSGSGVYGVTLALSSVRGKTVVFDIDGEGKAAGAAFLSAAAGGGGTTVVLTNRITVR
jgi:hypothetical protein